MTLPNPDLRPARRINDLLTPKIIGTIVLTVAGWHFSDQLGVQKVQAMVSTQTSTLRQQNRDQEAHIKAMDAEVKTKVDRDTYDRDIRGLNDNVNALRASFDQLNRTLLETRR